MLTLTNKGTKINRTVILHYTYSGRCDETYKVQCGSYFKQDLLSELFYQLATLKLENHLATQQIFEEITGHKNPKLTQHPKVKAAERLFNKGYYLEVPVCISILI